MSFWDGSQWVADKPASAVTQRQTRTGHILGAVAEGGMIALLGFGLIAGTAFAAGGKSSPTLQVSTGTAGAAPTLGGSITVSGDNFTPSSGGQMVILWVGYPNDYCSPDKTVCHGFYAYPTVNDSGSFSMTFQNVTVASGTGTVSAMQYSPQNDKWRTVAKTTYTVP